MIGLEYILNLWDMQHQELAEKLGIKKQNIHLWIKGKQNVSKKYLSTLSKMFGVSEEYFQKELNEIDKLIIQKEKLKKELEPNVSKYQLRFSLETKDLEEDPIYESNILNDIELEIKKTRIIEDIREVLSDINDNYNIQMVEQIAMLLKNHRTDDMFMYTIDAVSHYYNVLPDWVGEPESDEFVEEFIELARRYDNQNEENE